MEWTNSDHQLILVYQGGSPQNKTYSNITIVRKGDKRNSMAFEKKVVGFCLCKDSPWAQDAAAVPCLLLCFPNELVALELQSPIQVLQAPYCTQLARSVVTTYQVCWDIDKTLMNTLRLLGKKQCIDTISKSWPIRGGQRAPKPSHASLDIAVVGHNNGIVKIYDISSALSVTLVCVVSVVVLCGHANLPPPADCGIKSVELQPKNRHMVLVCNSGEVLLLSFALSAATVSVKVASAVLDEPCETTIEKVIALSKPAAKLEVPGSPSASKKSEGSVLDADTEVEAPAPAPVEVDLEAPVVDFKNRFKKVSQVTAPPPEVEISGTDSDESMSDSERADTGDSTQPETDTPTDAAPEASAATVKATPSAATDTRSYEVEAYMPPGFQLALYFKGILNSPEDATPLTDGIIATHSSAYAALAVANGLGAVCVVDTAEGEVLMCEHLLQSAQLLGEAHPQSEKPPAKIQRLASDTITSLSFNAMFPSPSSDAEAKVDLTTPTPTLFITTAMSGVALAMVVPHTFCMLTSFDYSKTAQTWKDTNVIAKGLNNIVAAAKSLETSSRSLDKPACDSKPVVDTEPINTPTSGDTIILLTPDGRPIKSPQCQWDEDEDADVDISASVQLIDIAPNAASDTDPFVFGVAVSGSSVSLLSLPANVILSTFDTPNSMAIASATVINWSVPFTSPSGETVGNVLHCGLVLLDDVGNLSLLSLPDLKPIVPAAQTTLKGLTGIPSVSPDGRLVAISHTGSVEHWSIIRAENRLGLPASLGCFFTPGILLPPRETAGGGFLSSVFGGNDASVDRASLFTMSDGSDAMQRIAGAREHRDTAKQKMMDTKQQSETIGDTMRENKQMLQERGEKLESIGDKTEDMKNDAQNFLGNIREYNRKQAAKKWYQI
ncbi:hypothetical protein SARC_09658 [Sphaeroforma arctica JP610]|uniref:V-SNARE coiled-coil homology domain-containing protein n=1 Tax=Sphaeroforma arctica JP610 TaxID=667725 RepID=A0A0L0FM93_9EUKA|nr:hypothetical protein SARC_09658 [Sphaeroforma arctica JP610]KNC77892.1 hypothetical protein SARC_09658 [Sphaeroforma arctica JP610]|eukprot:XP_014151794.1 hypothetical protein SARC_09658 [Sphaeroforma arctica JP610]